MQSEKQGLKERDIRVNHRNAKYEEYLETWIKCSDCYDGQKAIKEKREIYLPLLSGQEQDIQNRYSTAPDGGIIELTSEYDSYLQRAIYYNYTKKIANGLVEQLFKKNVKVEVPSKMQNIIDDFARDGKSFLTSVKESNIDILLNYRSVLVLDFPENEIEIKTVADKEKANIRPYGVYYKAEDVINWRYQSVNNQDVLSLVVIHEQIEEYEDEFEPTLIEQYRVMDLYEGIYKVRIFRKDKKKGTFVLYGDEIYPKVNGFYLDFIPCFFLTSKGISQELDYPLVNDIADLNIAHYRNSADYENALNVTGSPTPVVKGLDDDLYKDEPVGLGNRILKLLPDGDAYFMEYKGQGPDALVKAMDSKVDSMSVIANKMLQNDPKGIESAETAFIRKSGENSQLKSMAMSLSESYEFILNIIASWMGIEGEIIVEFNTDYNARELNPQLFTNLNNAKTMGLISYETYFYNLKRNEMIPTERTLEEERESINSDMKEIDLINQGYSEEEESEEE